MKPPRIVQVILIIVLIVYLVLLQRTNQGGISLPFPRAQLPTAWVLTLVITFSWLIGWVPGRIAVWRKVREIRLLHKKIQDLEQHVPSYDQDILGERPVIPDRNPTRAVTPIPPDPDQT